MTLLGRVLYLKQKSDQRQLFLLPDTAIPPFHNLLVLKPVLSDFLYPRGCSIFCKRLLYMSSRNSEIGSVNDVRQVND